MKVAVVHEWLESYAGSEKVLEAILELFPQAELFVLLDFLPEADRGFLQGRKIHTSFLNRLPFARSEKFTWFLPLMPIAIEQFDLSGFDLIVSSSHAVAKGVITGPDQRHVSYVHSPMRYAWDLENQYLRPMNAVVRFFSRLLMHYLRIWDVRSSFSVDQYLTNSHFVSRRIRKFYRRESEVVHPWVDTGFYVSGGERESFYLSVSRLVPYKRMDLLVEAFCHLPDRNLVIIGDGPELAKLKARAGNNVHFLGYQSQEAVRSHLQRARAFLFPALEDFGIAPLEAQACGTPVIAYGRGGVSETIISLGSPDPTGLFFLEQTTEAVVQAIARFEKEGSEISAAACRKNALRFSREEFLRSFREKIQRSWPGHAVEK